jgi:molybdopterin molybdotransferase
MPEFLNLVQPEDAWKRWIAYFTTQPSRIEIVSTFSALGRVTAGSVISPEELPAFSRSTMDGFAVKASNTFGANDSLPAYLTLIGEVPMGSAPNFAIRQNEAAQIHTGGMLPEGADAVVPIENAQRIRLQEVEIMKAVAVHENIVLKGEDVSLGQEILPSGSRLRPVDIAGLMALGILDIQVAKIPKVGIISSGDEVIPPDQIPSIGQVRDINSYGLGALVRKSGGEPAYYGIVPDQIADLEKALFKAFGECDAVIITAGSSASTRDLTAEAIQKLGKPGVLVHGINIRPGKPTILAVCDHKPIMGLPGNPISAHVIASLFATAMLDRLQGIHSPRPSTSIRAVLNTNLPSQAGREEWIPVKLVERKNGYQAEPVFFKSSLIFNLVQADGLVHIGADQTGIHAGESMDVFIL